MTKQEEILAWLAKELEDWEEEVCHMVMNVDDCVATSPRSVAKLILFGLSDKGVVIAEPLIREE